MDFSQQTKSRQLFIGEAHVGFIGLDLYCSVSLAARAWAQGQFNSHSQR